MSWPLLVWTDSAPPKVLSPNTGLEPDRSVTVEIADSGVGFAPTTRGGVGLANVRDRLRLIYGERARPVISDAAQSGAIVTLTLPG